MGLIRPPSKFQGAIFDLDGLLIDSEPIWRWAQVIALSEAGANLTEKMQFETTGLGLDGALSIWRNWFPDITLETEVIGTRLQELTLGRIREAGIPMRGARQTLETCKDAGCLMAVASSSSPLFIRSALDGVGIREYFQDLVSAQEVRRGKPHPDVYLAAAQRLGLDPRACIAFEDSLHGLRSAKAAGMYCVAVPANHQKIDPEFGIADLVLSSLEEFVPNLLMPL